VSKKQATNVHGRCCTTQMQRKGKRAELKESSRAPILLDPVGHASFCAATGALSLQAVVRLPHHRRRPLCVFFPLHEQDDHLPRRLTGRQTPYDRLKTAPIAQGPALAASSPPSWPARPPPCQRPLCQATVVEAISLLDDA